MARYPAIKNHNLYYLYPHHMQPNPWVFTEFNTAADRRHRRLQIRGRKRLPHPRDGALVRDVKHRAEFRFDVR